MNTKTMATVVDLKKTDAEKLIAMTAEAMSLGLRMDNGRHYLMSTPAEKINAEDALEAFGFTKEGFDNH